MIIAERTIMRGGGNKNNNDNSNNNDLKDGQSGRLEKKKLVRKKLTGTGQVYTRLNNTSTIWKTT